MILFSDKIDNSMKTQLVATIQDERGPHLIKDDLPRSVGDLQLTKSFFVTAELDSSFLTQPTDEWKENPAYQTAANFVSNLACVNDCAERGIALIQQFNSSTTNEDQRQCLLQVVDQHRTKFKDANVDDLRCL